MSLLPASARRWLVTIVGVLCLAVAATSRIYLAPSAPRTVVINEAMASNGSQGADDDGDFEDWIELYNPTSEPISLAGYSLSDRPSQPRKWVLPEVRLEPGGHLLVWASGKSYWYLPERNPNDPLELGFVSAGALDGDRVALLLDGENVAGDETGLHLAVLDARGTLLESQVFRTHETTAESDRLVAALRAVSPGQVVMMAIKGDGSEYLTDEAVSFLIETLGSDYAHRLDPDDSWGLIAVVGGARLAEEYRAFEGGLVADGTWSSDELHASFRLRRTGEFLGLYGPDSRLVDAVSLLAQTRNSSWGRHPDGMPSWCHYAVPTPRAPNALFCTPQADAAIPSRAGGYYGESITVSLGNSRVTEVRFTLDGSTPTEASQRYLRPIELTSTAVLRTRAYRDGFTPSEVVSASYFIDEIDDAVALPVVSLITDPAHLWDEETGIYADGPDPDDPNYEQGGMAWERPVTMEFYEEDGTHEFTHDAGIRILGGKSREFPKKNFVVYFRSQYGDEALRYPLFPAIDRERFRSVVLRMGGDDGEEDMPRMRDPLMHTLWGEVGGLVSAARPVFLYLNGRPWGIYNLRERVDVDYLSEHFGEADVDLIRESDEVRAGDLRHWETTSDFFRSADLSRPDDLARARGLVDLDNLTDFYLFQIYAGNIDLVEANLIKYRPRTADGRWRWLMWDVDVSFGLTSTSPATHNTLAWFTRDRARPDLGFYNDDGGGTLWATLILRRLLEAEDTRHDVLNRLADLLNTTLSQRHVVDLIDEFAAELDADISYDLSVWAGDWDGSYEGWRDEVDDVRDFARVRTDVLRGYARDQFGLTDAALTIDAPLGGRGQVRVNSINVEDYPWTGRYFQEVPVTVEAIPANGLVFAGWSDPAWPQTPVVTVSLTTPTRVQPRLTRAPR